MVRTVKISPALLSRTEINWLSKKIQVSNGYERKMKSDIRRKIRIFNELELPLLLKSGFISATANCNNVTTNCNMNHQSHLSDNRIQSQNIVGREGFEPSNPAMSRRYLNQARPPARHSWQALNRHYDLDAIYIAINQVHNINHTCNIKIKNYLSVHRMKTDNLIALTVTIFHFFN